MKKIDIVVIGAGLYVCGKGTEGYGTILPAIFEWNFYIFKGLIGFIGL